MMVMGMLHGGRRRVGLAVVAALLVGGACANDEAGSEGDPPTTGADPTTTTTAASTTTAAPRSCDQEPTVSPVQVAAVGASGADVDVTSFDGTPIRAHWYPAPGDGPHATVLMGPGWSQPGATIDRETLLFGALSITGMNEAGYNVVTWDPRGFGASGGLASVNDPNLEGRDVQVLIDWVAEQQAARLDRAGDPRVGMVGASYGGGIQLTVASIDCRVDALVPSLAWHSLSTALDRNRTVKAGWAGFLNTAALTFGGRLDPHITSAATSGIGEGLLSDADRQWFVDRGPGDAIDEVTAPTLFVQGTVDTLFTLDEAVANYASLRKRGVPTAMIWFCGGHGTCMTDAGDTALVNERSFAWLRRYLDDDTTVDLGDRVDVVDQLAAHWTADDYPVATGEPIVAAGSGTLALDAAGQAGPLTAAREGANDILSSSVLNITPAKAATAVEVTIDPGETDALVLGAPTLDIEYTGTTPAGERPTRVFAQLIDDDTGIVVGNQITPVEVVLDGTNRTVSVELESIAFHARPGHTLTLQIVASTVAYAAPRFGGTVDLTDVSIGLPTARDVRPS